MMPCRLWFLWNFAARSSQLDDKRDHSGLKGKSARSLESLMVFRSSWFGLFSCTPSKIPHPSTPTSSWAQCFSIMRFPTRMSPACCQSLTGCHAQQKTWQSPTVIYSAMFLGSARPRCPGSPPQQSTQHEIICVIARAAQA